MKTNKQPENIQKLSSLQTTPEFPQQAEKKPRTDMFSDYSDVVGVEEMCEMLGGIGKNLGYQLLRDRKIPHIRIGRTIKIAKPDIINFVLNIEAEDEFFYEQEL